MKRTNAPKTSESSEASINSWMMDFIASSPGPFHAAHNMATTLEKKGFTLLDEHKAWKLKEGQSYYVMRNSSSLIAFTYSAKAVENGMRLVGAHTDSPCLKIKPRPDKEFKNWRQWAVEVYGGVLLYTWFDRDLGLAGRASYLAKDGSTKSVLVDFKRAMAIVSSLAIHLNRGVNDNHSINAQKEMPPLVGLIDKGQGSDFYSLVEDEIKKQKLARDLDQILGMEFYLYDMSAPSYVGANDDFIASARLDNLLSCSVGLKAFLDSQDNKGRLNVLVCQDHEEVGSCSHVGADGPFLSAVLKRLFTSFEDYQRAIERSVMISADNAHAIHPNYPERHDENHGPLINHGPVIKINANQRYATNSETAAIFSNICLKAKVPYQHFAVRSDMGCGSTIGPLTASQVGLKVVDIGVPTLAMHSIRELCG